MCACVFVPRSGGPCERRQGADHQDTEECCAVSATEMVNTWRQAADVQRECVGLRPTGSVASSLYIPEKQ